MKNIIIFMAALAATSTFADLCTVQNSLLYAGCFGAQQGGSQRFNLNTDFDCQIEPYRTEHIKFQATGASQVYKNRAGSSLSSITPYVTGNWCFMGRTLIDFDPDAGEIIRVSAAAFCRNVETCLCEIEGSSSLRGLADWEVAYTDEKDNLVLLPHGDTHMLDDGTLPGQPPSDTYRVEDKLTYELISNGRIETITKERAESLIQSAKK